MRPVIQFSCIGNDTKCQVKVCVLGKSLYWCDVFILAHSREIKQKNGLKIAEQKKALEIFFFPERIRIRKENKKKKEAAPLGKQLY